MKGDISKNTIVVLVILTVVISLIGTWTVVNEASNINVDGKMADNEASSAGQVKLTIIDPPVPIEVEATGQVILSKTK